MRHNDVPAADGLALPRVRMDAVRHDRVVLPQPVLGIGLPILLAVGVQLLHKRDFSAVLGQVRLDI